MIGEQGDASPAQFFGVQTVSGEHKNRPCALPLLYQLKIAPKSYP